MAKDAKEVKVQDRYNNDISVLSQEYGQGQEPLDYKRLRNKNFGEKQNISNNTVYYTKVAGRVVATGGPSNNFTMTGYNDYNSNPTTIAANTLMNGPIGVNPLLSITFPVYANSYYKVNSTGGLTLGYFIPL